MDFYSALGQMVAQIPRGRISFLSDVAAALGDKASTVSLPRALARIGRFSPAAAGVVKADGSLVITDGLSSLRDEGVEIAGSRVSSPESIAFNEFITTQPLKKLRGLQLRCANRVVLRDGVRKPETVAGLDVSYDEDRAFSVAVLMEVASFDILAVAVAEMEVDFPYIPGYLAFRELPPLTAALKKLPERPALLFVDGHGILHPARCGIASHLGLTAKIPTIGVGKSHLVGEVVEGDIKRDEAVPVKLDGRVAGFALRPSLSKRPIYVSPGNLITPRTALRLTREMCLSRMPEPIRQAHAIATEKRKIKKRALRGFISRQR